eukprot:CAMPEP_0202963744 /NCGR_PEP_ID=MMETSP1396-20130829/7748_1 /ASSEMBLY_ACC=CAM_ASM_000872 /TAXON_ID= /ORGANISM="Pseudokeronopsis sp., Strain Brazil" /LENGTH=104 /DNA_ID=CAMNT_0049685197 /DNA_START=560 /DNA_END=874 /DNA_ORIENTATION=-
MTKPAGQSAGQMIRSGRGMSTFAPGGGSSMQAMSSGNSFTKQLLEYVKKGELEKLKLEQERLGINIAFMVPSYKQGSNSDDGFKYNAIFYACLIKEEDKAHDMC